MNIISIDIETAGAVRFTLDGRPMPRQRSFHPRRMVHVDGIPPSELIQTVAITRCEIGDQCSTATTTGTEESSSTHSPGGSSPKHGTSSSTSSPPTSRTNRCVVTCSSSKPPSRATSSVSFGVRNLSSLKPCETMVLIPRLTSHRKWLIEWLKWSQVLIGQNLLFDLGVLMADPGLLRAMGHQTVVDTTVLAFLDDPDRPPGEKSLKSLVRIVQADVYEGLQTLRDGHRFRDAADPELHAYNGADTHGTALVARQMSKRLVDRYGEEAPGPYTLGTYSEIIWGCARMARSGVGFSIEKLTHLETHLQRRIDRIERVLSPMGLKLTGPGSLKARYGFMAGTMRRAMRFTDAEVVQGGLVFSEKQGLLTDKDVNRSHLRGCLPPRHTRARILRLMDYHAAATKIIGSYTYPLLRHKRRDPDDRGSVLIGKTVGLAYPTFYPTPSATKDGTGEEGGTQQVRLAIKHPPLQTLPPLIQRCRGSRWGERGVVVGRDAEQLEVRIATIFSGDPRLIREFEGGGDCYRPATLQIFGEQRLRDAGCEDLKKSDPVFSRYRQIGKMAVLADQFLSSATTMFTQARSQSKTLGIEFDLEFFRELELSRAEANPHLFEWQKRLAFEAQEKGYLMLPFFEVRRNFVGFRVDQRKLRWKRPMLREQGGKRIHEVVNFPVQAMGALSMLEVQNRLHRVLMPEMTHRDPPCHMMYPVHDAIYFDCRVEWQEELEARIAEAFEWVEQHGVWGRLCEATGNFVAFAHSK